MSVGALLAAAGGGLPVIPPSVPGEIGCYSSTGDERDRLAELQAQGQEIAREDAELVAAIAELRDRAAAFTRRTNVLGEQVRARIGISAERFQSGDQMNFDASANVWRWLRPSLANPQPQESAP